MSRSLVVRGNEPALPFVVTQGAALATVRIYKVAELLGLSSQEAMDLLKKETGIGVKSASSSIEEIVARQFVERHARKRQIALPHGPLFADTPAAKRPALQSWQGPRAAEAGGAGPAAPARQSDQAGRHGRRPRRRRRGRPRRRPSSHEPVAPPIAAPVVDVEPPPVEADQVSRTSRRPRSNDDAVEVDAAPRLRDAAPAAESIEPPAVAPSLDATRRHPRPLHRSAHLDAWCRRPAGCASRIRVTGEAPGGAAVAAAAGHPAAAGAAGADTSGGRAAAGSAASRRHASRHALDAAAARRAASAAVAADPSVHAGSAAASAGMPYRPGAPRPPFGGHRPRARRAATIGRQRRSAFEAPPPPITKLITLAEGMSVKDLADKLEVKAKDVLKKLMDRRMMMTINSTLDADTAQLIARDFGAEVLMRSFEEELTEVETEASKPEDLVTRAPGRHRHGPRRSRQDDAARRDP